MSTLASIKSEFESSDCTDASVLDELLKLSRASNLHAKQLSEAYDVFASGKKILGENITLDRVNEFAQHLNAKQPAKENARQAGRTSIGQHPMGRTPPQHSGAGVQDVTTTAAEAIHENSLSQATFEITAMVNAALPDTATQVARPEVLLLGPHLPVPFRTMRDWQQAAALSLERRITAMEAFMTARGWSIDSIHSASTETVHVVGRVCASTTGQRGPESSLMLEGSRASSQGVRVKLDTSVLPQCALFPGQVIAVRGRNPMGDCVTAHEVVDGFAALEEDTPDGSSSSDAARVLVAAGPFTPASTMDPMALLHVLKYAEGHLPDVLLLVGPFVPDDHPAVLHLGVTFADHFEAQVMAPLKVFLQEHPSVQVVLQPAVADAHHLPVHPQPPLMSAAPRVHNVPSPAHLRCGPACVSVSSIPVLPDIAATEVSRQQPVEDRMARLFRHVLKQRCMHPGFPASIGTCIDYTYSQYLEFGMLPDVLVMPSPMVACAKVESMPVFSTVSDPNPEREHTTLCLNPGIACRGQTGTFMDLTLHPSSIRNTPWDASKLARAALVSWKEA